MYPYFLRSLHSIRPDCITRSTEREIVARAEGKGFQQVGKPWWWKQFLACAPKLDWMEDRLINLPLHLAIGTIDCLGLVCEWRPFSGIGIQIFDSLGSDYRAIEGLSLLNDYSTDGKWTGN